MLVITVRGIWPNFLVLDGYSVFLIVVVSFPFIAPFLKSFRMLGGQFDFRDSIEKIENYTKKSIESKKASHLEVDVAPLKFTAPSKVEKEVPWPPALNLEKSLEFVEEDPVLALASLRIELEKTMRRLYCSPHHYGKSSKKLGLGAMVRELHHQEILDSDQVAALKEISNVCNKAIHGNEISKKEATNIIQLTEELSVSFPMGYVPNFEPNEHYEEQGLVCEWQHCIELSPFTDSPKGLSCHLFGHDCPGGVERQIKCKSDWEKARL